MSAARARWSMVSIAISRRALLQGGLAAVLMRSVADLHGQKPPRKPDVFFAPTPEQVVDAMLRAVNVTSTDLVYDLGSGDGRIPIAAARMYGARGVGIDIDPALVKQATTNARTAGVSDKVRFLAQDLFTTDISPATVVSLYLTPFLNFKLLPKLNRELKPGTRVVSHQWEMMDPSDRYEYQPEKKLIVGNSFIYVWTTPIVRKPS
jgi:cyclopropane fatty-acyl-phospholipid synthase-like methyltransferase